MAVEDYTTYTEVDANNHINYVGTNHIDYRPQEDEDCYAYKDFGVDHFTDFVHYVDVMAVDATVGNNMVGFPWLLANDLDDALGLYNGNKTHLAVGVQYKSTEAHRVQIYLREKFGANNYQDVSGWVLEEDTWYYFRIQKTGTALICDIYSTAELRNAGSGNDGDIDTLSLTLQADHTFRYIYSCNAYHAFGAEYWEGDIENLNLNEGTEPPTVTTQDATNVTAISAKLHGNITDIGDSDVVERGFDWDEDSGEPYANSWTEVGTYGTGAFEHIISSLDPEKTYYFRAKARNDAGWAYGSEKSFVTPAASYELAKKVVIGSTEIQGKCISVITTIRENKISDALVIANDEEGVTFVTDANIDDEVKIYFWDTSTQAWHQVFGGWVVELNPELTISGEICGIKAYGYGIMLKKMRVKAEYGTQSKRPTWNTLKEIITGGGTGFIDGFIEKVLATATSSGYLLNDVCIPDITSDFRYLYFPYCPVTAALREMCDLISAANFLKEPSEAGVHWIVLPDSGADQGKLCIATIGEHEAELDDVWATRSPVDPIEVTKDMIVSRFRKLEAEANYIVHFGKFEKPTGEIWTEGNKDLWGSADPHYVILTDDVSVVKDNAYSLRAEVVHSDFTARFHYPATGSLNLDISKISTKNNLAKISFFARKSDPLTTFTIKLYTGAIANNDYYSITLHPILRIGAEWFYFEFTLGNYAENEEWTVTGSPSWSDIDYIEFSVQALAGIYVYIDGLHINGIITRGAYDSTHIGAHKAKTKLITDSLAKEESLSVADDTGMVAQKALAQLLRSRRESIHGTISIKLDDDSMKILAGQLVHIHASRKTAGYHIDKDMRILQVKFSFDMQGGAQVHLTLTDDLKNSYPIEPADAYNALLRATNPDFQDTDRADLKGRDIDIEQTILAKDYPS